MMIDRTCIVCEKEFKARGRDLKRGRGKCCSLSCAASLAAENRESGGKNNNNWRGGTKKAESSRRYKKKYPEKTIAHIAVKKAISRGALVRLPCEVCGNEKSEAHHDDYSKLLEVRWLCSKHHKEHHRMIKTVVS